MRVNPTNESQNLKIPKMVKTGRMSWEKKEVAPSNKQHRGHAGMHDSFQNKLVSSDA